MEEFCVVGGDMFFVCLLVLTNSACLVHIVPFVTVGRGVGGDFIQSFLCCVPCTILATVAVPTIFCTAG